MILVHFMNLLIFHPDSHADDNVGVISLNDFELIRVIGRGSYAKVLMVELKKTKRIYAMKVIKKELVTDDEVRRCCLEVDPEAVFFNQAGNELVSSSTKNTAGL